MTEAKEEEWRPVCYAEGYEVSSLGRLKNKNGSIAKAKDKFLFFLSKRDFFIKYAHVVVADHFLEEPTEASFCYVTHLNGDRKDHRASNLQWTDKRVHPSEHKKHPKKPVYHPDNFLEGEVFREIEYRDETFRVSNYGRLCDARGKISNGYDHAGYRFFKDTPVHRLVALAFLPANHNHLTEINHKDGNKANNHMDNLEWVSRSQNSLHAFRQGIIHTSHRRRVRQLSKDGTVQIAEFNSIAEAAEAVTRSAQSISRVCHGRVKSCAGSQWQFIE
jgi:hypothetical protein